MFEGFQRCAAHSRYVKETPLRVEQLLRRQVEAAEEANQLKKRDLDLRERETSLREKGGRRGSS